MLGIRDREALSSPCSHFGREKLFQNDFRVVSGPLANQESIGFLIITVQKPQSECGYRAAIMSVKTIISGFLKFITIAGICEAPGVTKVLESCLDSSLGFSQTHVKSGTFCHPFS
jgi:hypothetical protein